MLATSVHALVLLRSADLALVLRVRGYYEAGLVE